MQWLREILQAKGIEMTDELIADVKKELPKYLVPKTEFNNKIAEIDNLKGQIGQRDTTIGDLQKKAGTVDDLTQQLNALQTKYDTDTGDLNKKLSKVQFDSALDVALAGSGAKNTKALRALLDMDKITFEEGKLGGFTEQLESIKAENDYLFDGAKPGAGGIRHGSSIISSDDAFIASARSGAGLETK
ncbi:MAG: phage scaffolding protein [Clostridia bacterium]|nr:phage scaffolding protein [Clostridia bacterium]